MGSGVYDGSEIHEASATLVSLSRSKASHQVYAPDIPQMHVINHTSGEEMSETRNVLVESARIARGKIEALDKLDVGDYDAVVFPGGFGAAKNLSNFAVKQTEMTVDEDVSKVINDFHSAGKPIGLCCIAPVLAAKCVSGCEVTVGMDTEQDGRFPYAGVSGAINAMGGKHVCNRSPRNSRWCCINGDCCPQTHQVKKLLKMVEMTGLEFSSCSFRVLFLFCYMKT